MKLVLFSGLGADDAIFVPQKLQFPELLVPAWREPLPDESLDGYAQRMVKEIGTIDSETWIGGASFGGILALHMAEHVQPKGVILLGSVHSPTELPLYARCARWVRWATPLIPVRLIQWTFLPVIMRCVKPWPRLYGLAWQLSRSNPRVIRWSIRQILEWKRAPVVRCPVVHIHGSRDWVLPARLTTPDRIVEGGGHIVSLTHSQAVIDFLKETVEACPATTCASSD